MPADTLAQRLVQDYQEQLRLYDQALDLVAQDTSPAASDHWAGELDGILKSDRRSGRRARG